jgi:hypothetical protein
MHDTSVRNDPDVVVRVDEAAARPGTPREIRGARNWAKGALAFSQTMRFVQPVLVNGAVGLVWAPRGRLFRVIRFTSDDRPGRRNCRLSAPSRA